MVRSLTVGREWLQARISVPDHHHVISRSLLRSSPLVAEPALDVCARTVRSHSGTSPVSLYLPAHQVRDKVEPSEGARFSPEEAVGAGVVAQWRHSGTIRHLPHL